MLRCHIFPMGCGPVFIAAASRHTASKTTPRRFIETAIKPSASVGWKRGEFACPYPYIHITPDHCHLFPVTYRLIERYVRTSGAQA